MSTPSETPKPEPLSRRQISLLLVSVWVISICGLVYELIIGTLSSYLLGSSVTHFSITIGSFLFAMGVGSYLSRFVQRDVLGVFVTVEVVTGICGGGAAALLMGIFAFTSYFYIAMFAAILIIGGCMGLEIPLLTRLVSERGPLKDHLAHILSVDYLGALIGSLLFPLVLLPVLGLLGTAFATGLLNLLVAGAVVAVFRDRLPSWRRSICLVGIAAVLLIAGLVRASSLSSFYERNLYSDRIVYSEQTSYQKIIMTRYKNDLRLFLDGSLQFSLLDEYRYPRGARSSGHVTGNQPAPRPHSWRRRRPGCPPSAQARDGPSDHPGRHRPRRDPPRPGPSSASRGKRQRAVSPACHHHQRRCL